MFMCLILDFISRLLKCALSIFLIFLVPIGIFGLIINLLFMWIF